MYHITVICMIIEIQAKMQTGEIRKTQLKEQLNFLQQDNYSIIIHFFGLEII